jgi:hypothetical protein
MIAKIIDALQAFEYYGESEAIEIAKGRNELVKDCKDLKLKVKRAYKFIFR